MDGIYELSDWAFDNALWVFIGMVAIVMAVGPWWLRENIRKHSVSISIGRSIWFCFLGGMASIVLFYLMLLAYNFAVNFICAFIGTLAGIDNFEISKMAFYIIYVLIYLVILQIHIRRMVMDYAKRNLPAPKHLIAPPINIPQTQIENKKSNELLKSRLKWDSGWPLTVMCGVCTILFYFVFTFQIRPRSSVAMYMLSLNGIAHGMSLYEDKYNVYPTDMGNLITGGYISSGSFITDASNRSILHGNESLKAPHYAHLNLLQNNTPGDTLWIWFDPNQYYTSRMPVAYYSGETGMIKKKELPALIERSRKWLAENPSATVGK